MYRDRSWLNRAFQSWLRHHELKPVPRLELDCHSCSRALRARPDAEALGWHKWKCCRFQPFVPNYLLGGVSANQVFPDRVQLTPIGLIPWASHRTRVETIAEEKRDDGDLCAFFDQHTRGCSIWSLRPSECATHFCLPSPEFESRSFGLFEVEMAVAQMAAIEQGIGLEVLDLALAAYNEGRDWEDDSWVMGDNEKLEFYQSCWEWSQELTWDKIRDWLEPLSRQRFDTWMSVP